MNPKTLYSVFSVITCLMLLVYPVVSSDYIPKHIDINKADTAVFVALPGIGPKLAARIVKYRELLGGFYCIEQVREVYGLQDSTFEKIKKWLVIKDSTIRKININKADNAGMQMPYINYSLANAIYQYRLQHGPFENIGELKKIMIVNDSMLLRLQHYLVVD